MVIKGIWFSLFSGEIKDGELHIGQTTVSVYNPENKTKVPDVLFYENHQVRAWDWVCSTGSQLMTIWNSKIINKPNLINLVKQLLFKHC